MCKNYVTKYRITKNFHDKMQIRLMKQLRYFVTKTLHRASTEQPARSIHKHFFRFYMIHESILPRTFLVIQYYFNMLILWLLSYKVSFFNSVWLIIEISELNKKNNNDNNITKNCETILIYTFSIIQFCSFLRIPIF